MVTSLRRAWYVGLLRSTSRSAWSMTWLIFSLLRQQRSELYVAFSVPDVNAMCLLPVGSSFCCRFFFLGRVTVTGCAAGCG